MLTLTNTLLDHIKIVMVNTSHPGNIGAAARAMRVMGIKHLTLVQPKIFPSSRADAMSSGALDVLRNAVVVDTLAEAIEDCQLVIATTARVRHLTMASYSVRAATLEAVSRLNDNSTKPIAFVYGAERTGLTNEHVDLCQRLMNIPTANDYNSLNIASAIQVTAYELRSAYLEWLDKQDIVDFNRSDILCGETTPNQVNRSLQSCSQADREHFYAHLERVMIKTAFLDPEKPKHLMRRLRLLFNRAEPDQNEINILRGILTSCEKFFKD